MLALIDGDILVYRVGFAAENVDAEAIVRARLEESIARILDSLETAQYRIYITSTDKSNFRFALYPDYKANRKSPKPKHYDYIRGLLEADYGAFVVHDQEADDSMGEDQDKDSIIVSIDKDLDQIPGWHYNFVKNLQYEVNPTGALRWFYHQCLEGDKSVDNIEGCPGIGKIKAGRILEGCETEREMFEAVLEKYQQSFDEDVWADKLLLAGSLLWIRRKGGKYWNLHGEVVSKEMLENYSGKSE